MLYVDILKVFQTTSWAFDGILVSNATATCSYKLASRYDSFKVVEYSKMSFRAGSHKTQINVWGYIKTSHIP